jgi:hypothetical protein
VFFHLVTLFSEIWAALFRYPALFICLPLGPPLNLVRFPSAGPLRVMPLPVDGKRRPATPGPLESLEALLALTMLTLPISIGSPDTRSTSPLAHAVSVLQDSP